MGFGSTGGLTLVGVEELGVTGTLDVGVGVTVGGPEEGVTGGLVLDEVEGSTGDGSSLVSPQAKLNRSQGAAAR